MNRKEGVQNPVGFHFGVKFIQNDGIDAAFQEVSGISMTQETKNLAVGGMNHSQIKLPVRTTYEDLELKRGMMPFESPMSKWVFDTMSKRNTAKYKRENIIVHLFDEEKKPLLTWLFESAYPIKWNVSGFNAQESAIVIESITLAYSSFTIQHKNK